MYLYWTIVSGLDETTIFQACPLWRLISHVIYSVHRPPPCEQWSLYVKEGPWPDQSENWTGQPDRTTWRMTDWTWFDLTWILDPHQKEFSVKAIPSNRISTDSWVRLVKPPHLDVLLNNGFVGEQTDDEQDRRNNAGTNHLAEKPWLFHNYFLPPHL